jgi:hypothetical protein
MKCKVAMLVMSLMICLSVNTPYASADAGKSTIQAFCRATLQNGEIVEGVIIIGGGGYQRKLDTHGFYLLNTHGSGRAILFNLAFRFIDFTDGIRVDYGGSQQRYQTNPADRVLYVHDVTSATYYPDYQEIVERISEDHGQRILQRDIIDHARYELCDVFSIYPELPDRILLGGDEHDERHIAPRHIPVDQIQTFELVNSPPESFLKDRARKEQAWDARYGVCDDCVLTVEWLDVINTTQSDAYRQDIQRAFKMWK